MLVKASDAQLVTGLYHDILSSQKKVMPVLKGGEDMLRT
jgi:hypothetical protein